MVQWIGLRDNWNRKASDSMEIELNLWFPVKIFPTEPIHWISDGWDVQILSENDFLFAKDR